MNAVTYLNKYITLKLLLTANFTSEFKNHFRCHHIANIVFGEGTSAGGLCGSYFCILLLNLLYKEEEKADYVISSLNVAFQDKCPNQNTIS